MAVAFIAGKLALTAPAQFCLAVTFIFCLLPQEKVNFYKLI
jgi:hypothetical protein